MCVCVTEREREREIEKRNKKWREQGGEEKVELFTHFPLSRFWMIYERTCDPMIKWTAAWRVCVCVCVCVCEHVGGLAANYPLRRNLV